MLVKKITEKDKIVSAWSGGTTTQLFIYPEGRLFAERNFDFRISSAVIAVEESEFTSLPGFSRIIMPLEGELYLQHEGQYSRKLKPFETDFFQGDWKTSSKGTVTDFNLIMGKNVTGRMEAMVLNDQSMIEKIIFQSEDFALFYVISGELCFGSESFHSIVQKGEMIVLKSTGNTEKIKLNGICELIEIDCRILE